MPISLFDPAGYRLDLLALPPLVTALAILLLGVFTLIRERRSRASWLFLLLTLTIFGWLVGTSGLVAAGNDRAAYLWTKAHQSSVYLIPAALYHFAVSVMGREAQRRRWVALAWAASGAFVVIALTSDWLAGPLHYYAWGYYVRYGWHNLGFLLYFCVMLFAALRQYWQTMRQSQPGTLAQQRARFLLMAFSIGYLGSVDYLPAYSVPLYPIGFGPVLAFVGLAAWSIRRYHLADITPAFAANQILQTMGDALLVLDRDGLVCLANRAAGELFGLDVQRLAAGRAAPTLGQVLPGLNWQTISQATAVRAHELIFSQPANSHGPAADRTLSLTVSMMPDITGQPEAAVCVVRDITDAKRAEARIRTEAARAEALARVAERLNAQLDLEAVLHSVCEEMAAALHVPIASVLLYDEQREVLYHAYGVGLPPACGPKLQPLPRQMHEAGLLRNGPVSVIPDVRAFSALPDPGIVDELQIRTAVTVTMTHEGRLVGRLNIATTGTVRHFTTDETALLQGIAHQAALAISNARLYQHAQRRSDRLQALRSIDKAIAGGTDLSHNLQVVLDQIVAQLGVDAVAVLLYNASSQMLEYAASCGFQSAALQHTRLPLGVGLAGRAVQDGHLVIVRDLRESPDSLAAAPLLASEGFVSYYAAPLAAKGQVTGVLELFHRSLLDHDPEWLGFLEALAGQAAIAIDSAQLFAALEASNAELRRAYDTTLEGWSRAMDLRDRETEGHTQRVTELTLRLARRLGLPEPELVHVRRGALLHDIGKMGIPDRILLKPGPLTSEEWEIMRRHPQYAYDMLAAITYLRPALDIPLYHHEKWDGTGYPRGLRGEHIPLIARLFAVVDVWDALRSDRPYRAALPDAQVRAFMSAEAGRHFDPAVADAFLRMIEEH